MATTEIEKVNIKSMSVTEIMQAMLLDQLVNGWTYFNIDYVKGLTDDELRSEVDEHLAVSPFSMIVAMRYFDGFQVPDHLFYSDHVNVVDPNGTRFEVKFLQVGSVIRRESLGNVVYTYVDRNNLWDAFMYVVSDSLLSK